MKAGSVWIGTDYAWIEWPKRGGPLPLYAKRVKVLKKYEKQKYGRDRNSTFVLVLPLLEDGQVNTNRGEIADQRFETEARNLVDLWENYEQERDAINAENERKEREWQERYAQQKREREEREAAQRAERLEQERLREIEREKVRERLTRLKNVLITRGFKPHTLSVGELHVSIPTEEVERWLGIDTNGNQYGANTTAPSTRKE